MSGQNKNDMGQLRATVDATVRRLEADPSFADEVKENPVAALRNAGLSDDDINAVGQELRNLRSEHDVTGFRMGVMSPCPLRSASLVLIPPVGKPGPATVE